jgi:hypothetical protein
MQYATTTVVLGHSGEIWVSVQGEEPNITSHIGQIGLMPNDKYILALTKDNY